MITPQNRVGPTIKIEKTACPGGGGRRFSSRIEFCIVSGNAMSQGQRDITL